MRRKRALNKRIIGYVGITAATLLCLGIQEPAAAQERERPVGTVEETKVELSMLTESRSVETELRGTIDVSLISTALPSDVEFTVNPEGIFDVAVNPGGRILCPSPVEFKITNNSVVPVRLEIVGVGNIRQGDMAFSETSPDGPPQNFRLVDQISEVKEFGTAILVLGTIGRGYSSEADFEQYVICPGKTNILVADLKAGEETDLQIYGKVSADFYRAYQLTMRPVLKISVVRVG